MSYRGGFILVLGAGLTLVSALEASAQARPRALRETNQTRRAEVLLLQEKADSALLLVQPGLAAADSANPLYHAIAGEAQATQGNVEAANTHFETALRLFPGYTAEIEGRRTTAWGRLYTKGVTAYGAGNIPATIAAWEQANAVSPGLRHEAYMNLGILYTQERDYEKAAAAYQSALDELNEPAPATLTPEEASERGTVRSNVLTSLGEILLFTERYTDAEKLFAAEVARDQNDVAMQAKLGAAISAQPGRAAEAAQIYDRLLGSPNLTVADYNSIGVGLHAAENYPRAAEAFAKVAEARRNSRDAWYNYANMLYAAKNWQALLPVATTLLTLDPLNEDSYLILKEAQRNSGQTDAALRTLETADSLPVKLSDLEARLSTGKLTIRGTVIGGSAPANSPVQIRFTSFDDAGNTNGTQTATVTAPARDATTPLLVEVTLPAPAEGAATPLAGYKYELVR